MISILIKDLYNDLTVPITLHCHHITCDLLLPEYQLDLSHIILQSTYYIKLSLNMAIGQTSDVLKPSKANYMPP